MDEIKNENTTQEMNNENTVTANEAVTESSGTVDVEAANTEENSQPNAQLEGMENSYGFGGETVKSNNKMKKLLPLIAVIVIALIIIIVLIAVITNARNTVNIDDYFVEEVEYSGYDGYATVETGLNILDYDALMTDLGIQSTGVSDMFGAEIILEEYIDIDYSTGEKPENLSNGEKMEYIVNVDYGKINSNSFKKKLKGKESFTISYDVAGLEEATYIDPFEAIEKVITTESYGSINVGYQYLDKISNYDVITDSYSSGYSFEIGETTIYVSFVAPEIANINAGDKITISLDGETDEYASKGIVFTSAEQEFSVATASEITSASQVTESAYNRLKELFEESAESQSNGTYTFVDMYFYSNMGKYTKTVYNDILAIYKYKSNAVGSEDVYVYLYISSPLITSDGEIAFPSKLSVGVSSDTYNSVSEMEEILATDEGGTIVTAFEKLAF